MKCKKLLLLNLGSTSFKFRFYDYSTGTQAVAEGTVECSENGACHIQLPDGKVNRKSGCASCMEAFDLCIALLREKGVLDSVKELDAVGYKAVHGGPVSGTQLVSEYILHTMEQFVPFAPAHNTVYLEMMRSLQQKYPELLQIARFETAFHQTIPEYRAVYGVPYEWEEKYGIRRYGFHGSSHEYIAHRMSELQPEAKNIISIHLGGSCSLCAIQNGKSIASSMGATPQGGLFQNNRVGDFDVFCLPLLVQQYGSLDETMRQLCTQSGLKGLSGVSNDLREVLKARDNHDPRADLAVQAFVDNVVGYVGMFAAYLCGIDAIVFTGGIGQNCAPVREMVCKKLKLFQLKLLPYGDERAKDYKISTPDSGAAVWVIAANEELVLARHIRQYVQTL